MIKMIKVHIFYKLFEHKKAGISNYIFLCLPLSCVMLYSVDLFPNKTLNIF